jgi:hypothetical protein
MRARRSYDVRYVTPTVAHGLHDQDARANGYLWVGEIRFRGIQLRSSKSNRFSQQCLHQTPPQSVRTRKESLQHSRDPNRLLTERSTICLTCRRQKVTMGRAATTHNANNYRLPAQALLAEHVARAGQRIKRSSRKSCICPCEDHGCRLDELYLEIRLQLSPRACR